MNQKRTLTRRSQLQIFCRRHTSATLAIFLGIPVLLVAESLKAQPASAGLQAIELRFMGMKDPVGLPEQQPTFGWQFKAADPNQHDLAQQAYRILVASSELSLEKEAGDL